MLDHSRRAPQYQQDRAGLLSASSNSEFGPNGKGKAVPSGSRSAEKLLWRVLMEKLGLADDTDDTRSLDLSD